MKQRSLSQTSTSELFRELERRQARAGEYEARRAAMEKELADIKAELSALEARAGNAFGRRHVNRSAGARTRSANHQPLNAVLQKAAQGQDHERD